MENERRDDWKHHVDEHLVNLTTAQKVTDRQLDDLEIQLHAVDNLLRGDHEEGTSGLIGRLETVEHYLAELRAIIIMDATGKKGLQHEVAILSSGERTAKERWQFVTAICISVISLLGLVLTNWDKIALFLHRKNLDFGETPIVHVKTKHRRPAPVEIEAEQ